MDLTRPAGRSLRRVRPGYTNCQGFASKHGGASLRSTALCAELPNTSRKSAPEGTPRLEQHNCLVYTCESDSHWRFKSSEGDVAVPVSGTYGLMTMRSSGKRCVVAWISTPAHVLTCTSNERDCKLSPLEPICNELIYPNRHLSAKVAPRAPAGSPSRTRAGPPAAPAARRPRRSARGGASRSSTGTSSDGSMPFGITAIRASSSPNTSAVLAHVRRAGDHALGRLAIQRSTPWI